HRSPEELYQFWRTLENLPRFMRNLEQVEVRSDRLSHWEVRGPAGMRLGWDAEIINEVENRLIGWRSLPGAQVDNGGSVHFEPAADGSTIVRVSLQYNPPAGGVGAIVARLVGEDPAQQIREDLARFREIMETGAISCQTTGKAPRKQKQKVWDRDTVQNASEESFPASDPPSWTPETL
ncbi:MAG TPA: SRPBCC family protein, partial [Bryobacteraceae bacterium]|nr:SRPBCC family protein [Bryobacteraceae bacterium]